MQPRSEDFQVAVELRGALAQSTARSYRAGDERAPCLILAHGAGAGHDSAFMVGFASGLAERGVETITFDFPYMAARRRVPDRPDVLEACWLDVARAVRARIGDRALFIGGKSMGGRIASQIAARPEADALGLRGLALLGYPLHPPGRLQQLRVAHWPSVRLPALFVQGERDAFGTPAELQEHLGAFGGRAEILVVEGGDHSLKPPRGAARTAADTYAWAQDEIANWILAAAAG